MTCSCGIELPDVKIGRSRKKPNFRVAPHLEVASAYRKSILTPQYLRALAWRLFRNLTVLEFLSANNLNTSHLCWFGRFFKSNFQKYFALARKVRGKLSFCNRLKLLTTVISFLLQSAFGCYRAVAQI
jgi:hypothetical protein